MKKNCLHLSLIPFLLALFLTLNANASPEHIQFVIASGSMRPTFEVGDVITVQTDVNASQIYAAPYPDGDIIVLHPPTQPDAIFVRRVIQKSYVNGTYYFQTKGDANPGPDGWEVPEENIIGKVIAYSRTYTAGIWNDVAYNVTLYMNSTISNFNFSQLDKLITFDITGYMSQAENGFCNVTIPKNLLRCESLYEWQVRLNGTNVAYTATQNDTHTFIYFTHSYSTQNIQIIGTEVIPEFPSAVLLPVLMVAITLNILFVKRKLKTKLLQRFTKKRGNIQKSTKHKTFL
jgi:signal peptidase I